jgi:ABC-2 type transport system ATP-binding protein
MDRSQIKQQAQKYLDFFDMAKTQSRKIKTYSKGMMQKIGLIQALLADPDLLILDEPTSGMDPIAKAKVKQLFLDLKDRGKTVFLSTHILSDVQQIADRVAIINKGKLLKIDSVDNLLRKSDDTEILFSLESEKLAHLETGVIIRKRENGLQAATVGGKEARQKLLRQLVEVGADIIAVTPPRTDLEDIFVQLVENGNQSDTSDQSA